HETGTNAHHGSGDLFIAEADESDASLLQYRASMAIVTNVEPDHLNFFGTPEAYCQVFADFLDCIDPAGSLIVCVDDPGSHTLALYAVQKGIRVL
ncbi:Mur ligase family protein, partial [Klebsiella pneumoniae]|nr:Mur ligase family protein [Klebsiella pneumoniae]